MGPLLICTAILGVNAFMLWKLRTDDKFLNDYVRKSPKAWVWRKAFGEERAAEIIRTRFVPFGVVFWIGLLVLFAVSLIIRIG